MITVGARSNNKIVPITNFTKRTTQVTLTLAQYGTDPVPSVTRVIGHAYCDSLGNYRLVANGRYTTTSATRSRTRIYKDSLGDITFKNVANFYQAISCEAESLTVDAFGVVHPNSDTVDIKHSAGAVSHVFSMDVELNSKPSWFDANVENTPDVSAYIPNASPSETGLITAAAQSLAGVKTFNDGIVLDNAAGQSTLNFYATGGTTSPTIANAGTSPSGALYWTKVGNLVTVTGHIIIGASGSPTDNVTLTDIPAGFRPIREVQHLCNLQTTGDYIFLAQITTAGVVSLYRRLVQSAADAIVTANFANSYTLAFNMSYIVYA